MMPPTPPGGRRTDTVNDANVPEYGCLWDERSGTNRSLAVRVGTVTEFVLAKKLPYSSAELRRSNRN